MSNLLAISVGPVQEFIAAARRTRDLWFGSYLLSEISRAVAKAVESRGGKLIFPASSDAENVANVILAELHAGEPKDVAVEARKAAQRRWREFADQTQQEASGVIRQDIWDDQVDDVIEFYAVWVPRSDSYPTDRAGGMRLLSGRKNCRDFRPAVGRAGLPKSSLDGQRETVLHPQSEWQRRFRARLRIREGEQLDIVGLVKRAAEGNRPYPSVSRIAADPWVRGNLHRLEEVISACERLRNQGIIRRLDAHAYPQYANFPYEGTAVYPSRHHELLEEVIDPEERSLDLLGSLRDALAKLPEPNPYLGVLVADGDKMGAAISGLETTDENRNFSQTLAGFASEARKIVSEHNGVLVYAGGDDVLAILPVDKCLQCARKLRDAFGERMSKYGQPTLSTGIAIGHFMENLEDLLDYGRAAEKAAKDPNRDGLAVHLHKRGGSPIRVRSQWTDKPDERLTRYAQLIQVEAIPGKLPYDLRQLAEGYEDWPSDSLVQALRQDVLRVIRNKQPRAGRAYLQEIETLVNERLKDSVSLYRFAEELLVARQIATARDQARERPAPAEVTS
ncbi:MAG TPA: type III-B CRISPR-associated protein Cas10/Cmr2 [Gemmataceae bacterium]|nr:type III-B CRISPR-associated protein Cas10/Cmr2 [Gemmataceae bacterium]